MTALLLAPHNDDETLFAAFTIMRFRPTVLVCYRSAKQKRDGIDWQRRQGETELACRILGAPAVMSLSLPDTAPDEEAEVVLRTTFEGIDRVRDGHVFAPAVEDGGHEQHSLVGRVALDVFGDRVVPYLTYRRGHGRSTSEWPAPFLPEWPASKLAAMSMYRTQIAWPGTTPWFVDYGLREFYGAEPPFPLTVEPDVEPVEAWVQDEHELARFL